MTVSQRLLAGAVGSLNAGGRMLGGLGVKRPKLDADSLLAAARRRTGLVHFGEWPILEPLELLLDAYERESELTTLGRITVKELVLGQLENLLYLEAEHRTAPEVADERIDSPVFVIGLPRTGTTLLHGLISQDPESRVPLTWEVMYPARFANTPEGIAQARARTSARLAWANRLAPKFKRIHPIASDLPQECIAITALVFMSIQFHTTHNVPSYENWLEQNSQKSAYTFHRRFLQHLQRRRPHGRWVLKAPGHLFALDALLGKYPDARIVQTHRDPLRVMASMASHATVLRRAFSDRANPQEIAADWSDRWARALTRFLDVRDRSSAKQFLDVSYDDIEGAPLATVERIYDFLGWRLSPNARAAMRRFLEANPKNKHGVHRYSLSQYGLDRDAELERFAAYCTRFGIAVQADA